MQTIIFGASRQGRVVLEVLRAAGQTAAGFLDDNPAIHGTRLDGTPVLGGMPWAEARAGQGLAAIVAIGSNDARMAVGARLRALGVKMANAVHPTAVIQGNVSLGSGVLICAGAVVVTGTRVEDDVVINTSASIDHDSLLQTGCQVASGVMTAGCVTLGRGAFVGVGAVLGPSVTVGERAIIGAGSLVLADIPAGVLAYGAPCRVVRELAEPADWATIMGGASSLLARRTGR